MSALITSVSISDFFLTLVAEEPPPTLLTITLPGLLAGPVETARVTDALVAVAAFESYSAPVVVQLEGNTQFSPLTLPHVSHCLINTSVKWERKLTCTPQVFHSSHVPHRSLAGRSLDREREF